MRREDTHQQRRYIMNATLGSSVGLGLVIGMAIGALMDNVGMGVTWGLVFGAGIGVARSRQGTADLPDE